MSLDSLAMTEPAPIQVTRRPAGTQDVVVTRATTTPESSKQRGRTGRRGFLKAGAVALGAAVAAPVATASPPSTGRRGPLEFLGPYKSFVTRGEIGRRRALDYVLGLSHNQIWDPSRGGSATVDPRCTGLRWTVESWYHRTAEVNLDMQGAGRRSRPAAVGRRRRTTTVSEAVMDVGGNAYSLGRLTRSLRHRHEGQIVPLQLTERTGATGSKTCSAPTARTTTARWVIEDRDTRQIFALDGGDGQWVPSA